MFSGKYPYEFTVTQKVDITQSLRVVQSKALNSIILEQYNIFNFIFGVESPS